MKSTSQSSSSSNGRNGHRSGTEASSGNQETKRSRAASEGRTSSGDRDQADLDKVRDLLFGSQAKQHEQQIEAQSSRLAQLEASFAQSLAALEDQFSKQLRASEASLRDEMQSELQSILTRIDEQGTNKVERADLRSMLSDLASRLGD
jgi:flagellar biosynthesis regulator FlaF